MGEHLSLTVFTICLQSAIGVMLFVAIGRLLNKDGVFKNAILTAAGLGIVGMLASVLHLGRPLSAIRALTQFGSSWLSREIWFTAIFIGLTVLAAILVYTKPKATSAITGLASAAALVGLADVYMMGAIYSNSSVPVWQTSATYVEFYATALTVGALLFLVLSFKEAAKMRKAVALAVIAAAAIQVAVVVPTLISLGASSSGAVQSSLAIMGGMKLATIMKWLCIFVGAGAVLWITKDESSKTESSTVLGGAALVLAGQAVGRYVFYAAMVVSGVGLS